MTSSFYKYRCLNFSGHSGFHSLFGCCWFFSYQHWTCPVQKKKWKDPHCFIPTWLFKFVKHLVVDFMTKNQATTKKERKETLQVIAKWAKKSFMTPWIHVKWMLMDFELLSLLIQTNLKSFTSSAPPRPSSFSREFLWESKQTHRCSRVPLGTDAALFILSVKTESRLRLEMKELKLSSYSRGNNYTSVEN